MPAPKLQFAFQGGGAKFIAMLPVAAAIARLAKDEKIEISALAGTSAGAICAALIAAECDFDKLAAFLRANGNDRIKALRAPLPNMTTLAPTISDITTHITSLRIYNPRSWFKVSSWKNGLIDYFPFLKSIVFDGSPVLDASAVELFISDLFKCCRLDVASGKFSNIENYTNPRLFIAASDVVTGNGVKAIGNLRRAVVDSCSIPFALRSFAYLSQSSLVDGGLCNNLPVDYLLENSDAPIFLVYPSEIESVTRPVIRNILTYAVSVVSCPIEYNVKRAKLSVEESFHLRVDVNFSTFDFDAAMAFVNDVSRYDKLYELTIRQLEDFVSTYGDIHNQHNVRVTDTKNIADYAEMLGTATAEYERFIELGRCLLMVHVNENRRGLPKHRKADTVTMRTDFTITKEGFRFYRSRLKRDSDGRMTPSIWFARNVTKQINLPIRVLSLGSDPSSAGFQNCVVEFLSSKADCSVGDVIQVTNVTYRKEDMAQMNDHRNEFMSLTNPHAQSYDAAELRCRFPLSLGEFSLEIDDSKSAIKNADVTYNDPESEVDGQFRTLAVSGHNLKLGEKFYTRIVAR